MITNDEYIEILEMMEEIGAAREADKEDIETLKGNVSYLTDLIQTEYVHKGVHEEALTIIRDQQKHMGVLLADLTGLQPAETMNQDGLGKRISEVEQITDRVERMMSDTTELMKDVLMEMKNGPNPFAPNAPSARERLQAKLAAARR